MKAKAILVAILLAGAVLATTTPAEARSGFYVGFGFGWGRPHYSTFGSYYYGGYYPAYRGYRVWQPAYYYGAPAVVYAGAPYRYRVYRTYESRPKIYHHKNREYSDYTPRVYYRR